jgi:hypothetical protein
MLKIIAGVQKSETQSPNLNYVNKAFTYLAKSQKTPIKQENS